MADRGAHATPESRLLAFARSRSEASFRALYDAVTPAMFGFALRLSGGDRACAEDLVQDAWLRAVDRLDRFAAAGLAVRWLNGFVLNCWKEHRRRMFADDRLGVAADYAAAERATAWSEAPLLARAIDSLADGYRTVLVLHDVEGYTHAEIAAQLGIDEGTSKSQLTRARRQVRSLLGGTRAERNTTES